MNYHIKEPAMHQRLWGEELVPARTPRVSLHQIHINIVKTQQTQMTFVRPNDV
jgi:hypothetical protein